jgi:Zn-dependent M16 (insulinase) family peptidase
MNTIKISVPIESLAQAICSLNWSEQQKLREILDDQLFESEEEWEHSPEIKAEVAEAKKAYQQGEYQTLSEFITQESKD